MSSQSPEGKRIDTADHHDPEWHINEVAKDFQLIDAWKLPVAGSFEEFPELTELFLSLDFADDEGSKATQLLFEVRFRLGAILGWDDEVLAQPIPGCEETSLRDRLPAELKATVAGLDDSGTDFQAVYQTENESVLELSNSTVHAALHLAWVKAEGATYVGQMGIYVKNRGKLGQLYMPAIAPFRHYIVYPALMRRLGPLWEQREPTSTGM